MIGRNRYLLNEDLPYGQICVFISHQKNDAEVGKLIADYLMRAGINVYFDEYDRSIDRNNPLSVVKAISKGLNCSSHLLCILSENALASTWVPWEVGYGYNKNVTGLTVKAIAKRTLPEYLQVIPIIKGTKTLNEYISKIAKRDVNTMINEQLIIRNSQPSHPLDEILDWQL